MIWVMTLTVMLGFTPILFTAEFDSMEECKAASVWFVKLPGYHEAECKIKEIRTT